MPPATQGPARIAPAPLKRKIVAILASDVAGYSRLVAADEEGTLRALARARDVFDVHVEAGGGRIFNTAGDSIMCEFDSAVEAVRAAIAIQEHVTALGADTAPDRRLAFRIGLTIGDVVEQEGDLLGDGVNMAARLEGLAPVGGLCLSRSMHEAVANKVDRTFTRLGEKRVKNMPTVVEAWTLPAPPPPPAPAAVAAAGSDGLSADPRHRPGGRVPGRQAAAGSRGPLAAILVLGLAGAGWAGWTYLGRPADRATADRHFVASEPRTQAIPVEPPPAATPPRPAVRTVTRPDAPKVDPAPARPEPARPDPVRPEGPARAEPAPKPAGPASLKEGYEIARGAEARGDRMAAIAAYAALAPLARDQVDPFVRDAALLRQRGGPDAARRALDEVAKASGSRGAALVAAAQGDGTAVIGRLEAFAAAQPDYPPAQYLLGEAYLARPGGPSLTERRLAYDAFDRFVDGADGLAAFFVDPGVAATWLDAARKRRGEIESAFAGSASRPRVGFTRNEVGWTARIALPEPATRVTVRFGEQGAVQTVPVAGAAARSVDVGIPPETGRTTLYVGYLDASGREAGPYPVPFDPESARVASARETLERFPDSWVSFRTDVPDVLSYAQLAANRCGIASVRIGYGDEPPSRRVPLPACDGRGAADAGPSVIPLPAGTEAVQVQIAYADGSESPVRTFRRP